MKFAPLTIPLSCALVLASMLALPAPTSAAQRQAPDPEGAVALVLPTRRVTDAPPAAPPPLPPGSERITPVTVDAIVRRQPAAGRAQTLRQTISRTADRIHVDAHDGREWLFERNSLDPRRVSGYLIEHASRTIVVYEESDLRNGLGLRGWANVLMLGFDLDFLSTLAATEQVRTISGIRFVRFTTNRKEALAQEAWWSADQVFPSAFVTADAGGSLQFSIERLRTGADKDLLRPPASRFPAYRVVDLSEWLEHH